MDIALKPSQSGWDIAFIDNDFETDASLRTAVILSLIIQARAEDEVEPHQDPKGWWADPNAGSKLWTLFREVIKDSTPAQVEEYIREALQWMVDSGLAVEPIQVEVTRNKLNSLFASITIQRLNNDEEVVVFNDLWAEIEGIQGFNEKLHGTSIRPRVSAINYITVNGERLLVNGQPLVLPPTL